MNTCSPDQKQLAKEKRKQDYLDEAFSRWAACIIDAHPHACFENALNLFLHVPAIFIPSGKFIEGWYVVDLDDEVVLNEHGWCELPDGTILDPTVMRLVPPSRPVYYFPGVERSWWEVKELVQKEEAWFPYVRCEGTYGADGLEHPAYRAAYEAAKQKVLSLARVTVPPKKMTFLSAQDLENDQQNEGIPMQMVITTSDENKEAKGL